MEALNSSYDRTVWMAPLLRRHFLSIVARRHAQTGVLIHAVIRKGWARWHAMYTARIAGHSLETLPAPGAEGTWVTTRRLAISISKHFHPPDSLHASNLLYSLECTSTCAEGKTICGGKGLLLATHCIGGGRAAVGCAPSKWSALIAQAQPRAAQHGGSLEEKISASKLERRKHGKRAEIVWTAVQGP